MSKSSNPAETRLPIPVSVASAESPRLAAKGLSGSMPTPAQLSHGAAQTAININFSSGILPATRGQLSKLVGTIDDSLIPLPLPLAAFCGAVPARAAKRSAGRCMASSAECQQSKLRYRPFGSVRDHQPGARLGSLRVGCFDHTPTFLYWQG